MFQYDFKVYNIAPSIERAWVALSSFPEHQAAIDAVGKTICEANLEDSLSLILVHRHASLGEGQAMVRTESSQHPRFHATVTEIRHHETHDGRVPLWWKLNFDGDEATDILEFSEEADVRENFSRVMKESDALREIQTSLRRLGLAHLLGLRVLSQAERNINHEEETFLETIHEEPSYRAFLERVKLADLSEKSIVGTTWQFFRHKEWEVTSSCTSKCGTKCVWRSPGHAREHGSVHCSSSSYI